MASNCENCSFRKKYDKNPESILGRLWKWHTKFCPGWKKYFNSLSQGKKDELIKKYKLN
ncbi:MAG: hypothetical protein RBR08_11690 [Desulforegulaceae bacterium]|nr:hypothetical protein [Desulforegulaceae bacterium]